MNNPELAQEHSAQEPQQAAAIAENSHLSMLDRFRDPRVVAAAITTVGAIAVGSLGLSKNALAYDNQRNQSIDPDTPKLNVAEHEAYLSRRHPKAKKTAYDAFGSPEGERKIIQRATDNDPITVKYVLPFVYNYGEPTPVKIRIKYDAKSKFVYSGVKRTKAPTYKKVFRKKSVLLRNMSLAEGYTTGRFLDDSNLHSQSTGDVLEDVHRIKSLRIRPNKSKAFVTMVNIDQCHKWPTISNLNEARFLKSSTGFDSQPADYPCLPPDLSFSYDGFIKARGYRPKNTRSKKKPTWESEFKGTFFLSRIKVANPPS